VHACLEREYTAPSATRPLYADFLDEAAAVLGEGELTRAAALFRVSAGHWAAVAAMALAAAGTNDAGGPEPLGVLADEVEAAAAAERTAATIMATAVRRL
jgi:hypothetical protein